MRKKAVTTLLLISILAGLVAATGCERSKPVAVKEPSKQLPANFPDDFPFDDKWKIVESAWTMDGAGRSVIRVRWEGPGRTDQALSYFYEELTKHGWGYALSQDLQTKILSVWRQTDHKSDTDRLIITPADPHGGGDGVFIAVQLTL